MKSCLVLSPSFVLVSGVKETDLRFTDTLVSRIGAGDEVVSSRRVGVVLLVVDRLDFMDADFLTFFVGFVNGVKASSSEDFLFLLFEISTELISVGFKFSSSVGSSLAYLSFSPSFFHAGMCFSTTSDREGIAWYLMIL